ncbi:hypothetical protein D9M71_487270 [compost metagenome]
MDAPCRQSQAVYPGHVPFGTEVDVVLGRGRRAVAIVGATDGVGQLAVDVHHPAQHAHALHRLTEHAQLDTAVVTLAIGAEHPRNGVGLVGRLANAEGAGSKGHLAEVVLGPHLDLAAGERREDLVFVDRGRGGDLALAQALHVVGIQRELVGDLEQYAPRRRDFFFVIARIAFDAVAPVIHLHPLPARTQGQQQAVVKKAKGVGQGHAGEAVFRVDLGVEAGWRTGCRCGHRVVEVARRRGIARPAVGEVHVVIGGGQVQRVADRPGMEPVT